MSSTPFNPSVSELLLVVVFQLGLCLLFLAEIADAARGYDTLLSLVGQVVGCTVAIGAVVILVVRRSFAVGR